MPGYELTEPWMTEEGMPTRGIWNTTYVTEDASKINIKLRKVSIHINTYTYIINYIL